MLGQSQSLIMGFAQSATQEGSPTKVAKQEDRQTCLPVTVRLIETSLDQLGQSSGELCIHGAEHGMLILVAAVESLTRQPASMEMSLNDGTGRIKARHYLTEGQSKGLDDVAAGRYISAFGNVRTSPVPHFVITGMRLISTADEISFHMIECAHAALKLQRGPVEPQTPMPKKVAAAAPLETPNDKPVQAVPVQTAMQTNLEGPALRKAIIDFLQKEADIHPEGSALESVLAHAKGAAPDQVRKSLEKLVDDGEVFTTIDDEHFSCV